MNAMEIDGKFVFAEALTAILGVTVKLLSDCSDSDKAIKLDVTDLPTIVHLGYEALGLVLNPVSHLTSLLVRWFIGEQSQTSQSASSSLRKIIFAISDDFFDPKYDFDFRNMSESKSDCLCMRGGEAYKRPYGWMRFALKVRDKYPDGNAWLGTDGWRDHSVPGEWPVSYHGTGLDGAEGIIKTHYKAGDGKVHGRGIYSSPDIDLVDGYVKQFTSQRNGKKYKVIMQNRVNPKKRTVVKGTDIWLVSVPEGTSPAKEKEIVESSIRPYGLLIEEM